VSPVRIRVPPLLKKPLFAGETYLVRRGPDGESGPLGNSWATVGFN
jgi:hypothetical protein